VYPCGFQSPNIEAARKFIRNHFDTLVFAPGERVADIGAQSGNLAGLFSLFYDSLEITLEDIDTFCLAAPKVRSVMRWYDGLRASPPPPAFRTHLVIGTPSSTTLPTAAYSKVFFMNTYHEVADKAAILAELYRITAPGGTLYVSERVSTTKVVKRKDCGHGTPLERDLVKAFTGAGFRLVRTLAFDRYRRGGDVVRACCFHFVKR